MSKQSLFPFKMIETSHVERKYVPKVTVISSIFPVNEITPPIDKTIFSQLSSEIQNWLQSLKTW